MTALTCDQVRDLAAEYVLDGLSPSVRAAVSDHLAGHPDGHPEFAELGGIAPALAFLTDPVAPPAALKSRLLAAAAATPQAVAAATPAPTVSAAAAGGAAASGGAAAPGGAARDIPPWPGSTARVWSRRGTIARWAFTAAAVVSIVALLVANLSLQDQVSHSDQFNARLDRALTLAAAPGSRVAVIGAPGTAGAGTSSGVLFGPSGLAVIPRNGPAILIMQGLDATDGGKVYEAWAIVGKQAPAPIGSFGVGGDGFGWLAELTVPLGEGVTIALTREPGPGATTPTLPIVALGTAAPSS